MLITALSHWNALQPYRSERLRCKNYTYGRQYLDTIDYQNRRITEEEYIRSEGNVPLKNNLIRRIVRNVLGVFRNNMRQPSPLSLGLSESDPDDLSLLDDLNETFRRENLKELYARLMEEYLIGGMVAVRKQPFIRNHHGKEIREIHTYPVKADSFFFNLDSSDPRGNDITSIGEIHTIPIEKAISTFANGPQDIPRLNSLCADTVGVSPQPSMRVVEYWRLEQYNYWICHDLANGRIYRSDSRPGNGEDAVWRCAPIWRYYFIAPDGSILKSGDSPYGNAGHPYIFKAYPFIDGEIHSFVADCIDQQRYINRLITLNDWILRASAKGVLLLPDGSLPDGVEMEDITEQWARFNGVITYKPQEGVQAPHQVSNNAANVGITDLLSVQLKMMEDVSGVNAALQGQLANGNISGTLFEMQTRQALSGLADIIESFESFMRDCSLKDIAMLRG